MLASLYECFEAREWDRAVEIINGNDAIIDAITASQLLVQAADFQAETKVFDSLLSKGADINVADEEEVTFNHHFLRRLANPFIPTEWRHFIAHCRI